MILKHYVLHLEYKNFLYLIKLYVLIKNMIYIN